MPWKLEKRICLYCHKEYYGNKLRICCSKVCAANYNKKIGKDNHAYKHGMTGSRFRKLYEGVVCRCDNPSHKSYKDYGGRGITTLWKDFLSFKKDMYKSYLKHIEKYGPKNTQIDRINNNDNYYKENCRWVTCKENSRNRRTSRYIEYNGVKKCIAEWAEILGVHRQSLRYRLNNGWTIDNIIEVPINYSNTNGNVRIKKTSKRCGKRFPK